MDIFNEARKQFPITRRMIYLDSACNVPPPESVLTAVTSYYQTLSETGENRQFLDERTAGVCDQFGGLINATSEEVVIIKNTTEGLNIAANGLPLKAGDNVVITDLEHQNNVYPWINLQDRKEIEVRILKSRAGRLSIEDLSNMVDERTRALSISFVTFTGLKIDLKPFGEFCKAHDIYFIVDGIQGVGRLSLDVKDSLIDIMSCGGHKALMAGRGIGCLFIDKKILEKVKITYAGPPAANRHDPVSTKVKRSNDVKKFNAGSANYGGICALDAGLEFLDKIGIAAIESRILHLGRLLVERLQEVKGVKILSPLSPEESSGIVSFTTPDDSQLEKGLAAKNIRVSFRGSGFRVSPNFFNTEEEISRAVEVLAALC
jgi:selenocysteine lyase/cysteine desulfurase